MIHTRNYPPIDTIRGLVYAPDPTDPLYLLWCPRTPTAFAGVPSVVCPSLYRTEKDPAGNAARRWNNRNAHKPVTSRFIRVGSERIAVPDVAYALANGHYPPTTHSPRRDPRDPTKLVLIPVGSQRMRKVPGKNAVTGHRAACRCMACGKNR